MAYQRAQWSSGLTYKQVCPTCNKTVSYTDKSLDFRPWYADGYVDCPVCKTHLRHNEKFAVNAPTPEPAPAPVETDAPQTETAFVGNYCTKCGNKFGEGHIFCRKCGTKRN